MSARLQMIAALTIVVVTPIALMGLVYAIVQLVTMRTRSKNPLQSASLNDDCVEVRGPISRRVINVIDAIAIHQRTDRISVLRSVLSAWADDRVREADLIRRVNHTAESSRETNNRVSRKQQVRPSALCLCAQELSPRCSQ